mgnify:CR=1 FL=1
MTAGTVRYGTRWSRACVAMVAALVPAAGIVVAAGQGALAGNYRSQDATLGLKVTEATAVDAAIVVVQQPSKTSSGNVYGRWQLRIAAQRLQVRGLCVTQEASFYGRPVTLRIYLDQATVDGIVLDAEVAQGDIALTGDVKLNASAAAVTVTEQPALEGQRDDLGIKSDGLILRNANARLRSGTIHAGRLPSLRAALRPGSLTC